MKKKIVFFFIRDFSYLDAFSAADCTCLSQCATDQLLILNCGICFIPTCHGVVIVLL